jgi:hypothetical protein
MINKLQKKLKNIWIENSMVDGLLLLAEILDWMLHIRKGPFYKLLKGRCKLLSLGARIDML